MRRIPLTRGLETIVDDSDYESLSSFKWTAMSPSPNRFYAVRGVRKEKKDICYLMHRVILGAQCGQIVDHIDGDSLNNSRSNLRICSIAENIRNQGIGRRNTSGFKGVYYSPNYKSKNKFTAQITINHKRIHLGIFYTAELAAMAYNEAAILYHGKFARLNKI